MLLLLHFKYLPHLTGQDDYRSRKESYVLRLLAGLCS